MRTSACILLSINLILASSLLADEKSATTRPAATQPTTAPADSGFKPLFNGKDLTGWTCKEGTWAVEDGILARKGGGDIWTRERYGDFVLDLEVKFEEGANSGIFFRTDDIKSPVQSGLECQILDSHGKNPIERHAIGSIYDVQAPSKDMTKPAGEWNRMILTCDDNIIKVSLNGEQIIDMDLNKWTQPKRNPDGSRNKFKTAYKDLKREGHIGFQDHGKSVWFRNVRIKPIVHPKAAEQK